MTCKTVILAHAQYALQCACIASSSVFLKHALELSYSVYVIIHHGFEFIQFSWSFLKTSDYTDESRKDQTSLEFKMNKHIIITRKISEISEIIMYFQL